MVGDGLVEKNLFFPRTNELDLFYFSVYPRRTFLVASRALSLPSQHQLCPQKQDLKTLKFAVFSQVAAGSISSTKNCVAEKPIIQSKSRGFGLTFPKRIKSVAIFFAKIFTFSDEFYPKKHRNFLFFLS